MVGYGRRGGEPLDGWFTARHAFMVRHYLDEIDQWKSVITAFDTRVSALLTERERGLANLATIPGIGRVAAEIVIAETGGDMAQFDSAHRLASRIGVCPGQNESAGVNRSGRTRPGNKNLNRLLGIAAMVAIRRKDSYLGVLFRRLAARQKGKRALAGGCTNSPSPSGTSCTTTSPTANSAPTTSPAAIPNAPCAA